MGVVGVFWTYLRVFIRFFGEGVFCYSLFSSAPGGSRIVCGNASGDKRNMLCFVFTYAVASVLPFAMFLDEVFYRLIAVIVMFLYFWKRNRCADDILRRRFNVLSWRCVLTAAVFSVLVLEFAFSVCHALLHMTCVHLNVYNAIRDNEILYGVYKSVFIVLHLCTLFFVSKLRVLKLEDIRAISAQKWVTFLFSFCLLSIIYIRYNYVLFGDMPSLAPYRDVFLWVLALLLPVYLGFYLVIRNLTELLNVKANCAVDNSIFVWIFNPTVVQKAHLNIYDSDLFMPSFESNKLAFKQRLEKLGIDNSCSGYSMLVFCLILTKLFMGLKGWSFERDVFGQASLVVDVPFPEVRKSIESVIERVWFLDDASVLIDGYYLPCCNQDVYDEGHRPTVEEFLTCMAKSV